MREGRCCNQVLLMPIIYCLYCFRLIVSPTISKFIKKGSSIQTVIGKSPLKGGKTQTSKYVSKKDTCHIQQRVELLVNYERF